MKRVLITGINGFVGSHLAEYILSNNFGEVFGLIRNKDVEKENIAGILNKIQMKECDINDAYSVKKVIEDVEPDLIFHLAAQSYVPSSWSSPVETMQTNVMGSMNIFEAVRNCKNNPIIQIAGSSEEYGMVYENEVPMTEDNPLRPLSPYGVSKVAMDLLGYQYHQSYGLKIIRTRAFNHSIIGEMPVIVREKKSSLIDIVPIQDLRKKREKAGDELWNVPKYQIWDGKNFVNIVHMSAHFLREDRRIYVVNVPSGLIKCTSGHSLLNEKYEEIKAKEVKKGDKIAAGSFPATIRKIKNTKEVAYLLGAMCAEGCVKEDRRVTFTNTDNKFLNKIKRIFIKNFEGYVSEQHYKGVTTLSFNGNKWFVSFIKDSIYTKYFDKKVPKSIINADINAQKSFLDGFNKGDGFTGNSYSPKRKHKQYTTKSPTLAMGLCYLISTALKTKYSISYEDRNAGYYHIYIHSTKKDRKNWGRHLEKPENEITKLLYKTIKEKKAVYDFETKSHHFMSGPGRIIVHNTGPRRGEVFVTSNWAKQIALIEAKKQEPVIKVGALDSIRDFTDVRDIVRAYWLATQKCKYGEAYNLCSEKGVVMKDLLNLLFSLSKVKPKVEQDPDRLRPSDVKILLGSCKKFKKQTGWKAEIPFEKTMEDLLNYWREKI